MEPAKGREVSLGRGSHEAQQDAEREGIGSLRQLLEVLENRVHLNVLREPSVMSERDASSRLVFSSRRH